MIIKKIISIVLAFANITLLFSVLGFCEESQSVQVRFSERLKDFLANNSSYTTIECVDGEDTVLTNRLVVSTNSNEPIENDMGAVDKLEGSYNWHFFQYSDKASVEEAYHYYEKQDYVNYVETDDVVEIYDPIEMYSSWACFELARFAFTEVFLPPAVPGVVFCLSIKTSPRT